MAKLRPILISLAFCIAAMEGFLYLAPSFQATRSPVDRIFCEGGPDYVRPSDRFGTIEAPKSIFFERQNEAENWALHFVNDMGFRDVYDNGDVGAIVLGDSFARGTLVSNHETFAGLLDRWQPNIAFHNFGIGGFGTADAYRVYQEIADETPHRLVVLSYYVGNDVNNNLKSGYALDGNALVYQEPVQDVDKAAAKSLFFDVHVFLSNSLRSYRLFYQMVQQRILQSAESPAETDTLFAIGEALTKALLAKLAETTADHDADLLIAILPDWNEPIDEGAASRAASQRLMIKELTAKHERVFAVDLAVEMANFPTEELFGRIDKHYARLGQHVTAAAIADWLNDDWQNAGVEVMSTPAYDPEPEIVIEPDCAMITDYRDRFLKPADDPATESERGGKQLVAH